MSEELMDLTAEEQMIATEQITPEEGNAFKLATVTALMTDGCAQIKFDEDEEASEKEYAYLSCYHPAVNDRVLLGIVGASYVILGKVNYAVSPATAASASINGVTLAGALSLGDIGAAAESHTHAWSDISSQPKINNKSLASGNNTLETLGIASASHTHSYSWSNISSQPQINSKTLSSGNNTLANLGIASASHSHSWSDISSQPQINSKTLSSGNNTLATLGIAAASHIHSQLDSGTSNSNVVKISGSGADLALLQIPSNSSYPLSLGNSNYRWKNAYVNGLDAAGTNNIAKTAGNYSGKLGFFGTTATTQQSVSYCVTTSQISAQAVAQNLYALEKALKTYGLIK